MADVSDLAELAGIPAAAQGLWKELVAQDPVPVPELRSELRTYQQKIARSASWSDEVDPRLARALAGACEKLLSIVKDDTPAEQRRAIQAAVRYFVIEEDAESDLDSVIGLDDDAEVVNAVLRHLGRENWLVKVS